MPQIKAIRALTILLTVLLSVSSFSDEKAKGTKREAILKRSFDLLEKTLDSISSGTDAPKKLRDILPEALKLKKEMTEAGLDKLNSDEKAALLKKFQDKQKAIKKKLPKALEALQKNPALLEEFMKIKIALGN